MGESYGGSKPACTREDALAVLVRLREAGHVAYFAGGCVRDLLLGREPKDWDVATDAPPERVRQLFSQTQAVGAAFGVILVRHRRSVVEVATFRADLTYEDGRRPTGVRFTTAEEDARRRDFTINGIFLDPLKSAPLAEQVIDYVGGVEDLRAKRLRAIGNPIERFEEDHLRMLRAIRFAARFDLHVEQATADAIAAHAGQLKRISPERIAEELRLMLTPPTRVKAWEMLWDLKLMPVIFRTLPEKPTARASGPSIFTNLATGAPVEFGLSLAAMVLCYRAHGTGPLLALLEAGEIRRSVQACRTLLKISNDEAEMMAGALDVSHLLRGEEPTVATMKRFLARSNSTQARGLLDALLRTDPSLVRIAWLQGQFTELERADVAPPPFVTGDDLVAAGLSPGPLFKRVLDQTYDEQLEGRVTTKDEALAHALRIAGEATG